MSLYLTKEEIYDKLKNIILIKSKKELLYYLNFTKNNFLKYTKNIDNQFGSEKHINPTLWQMGHVIFFYVNLVLKNLDNCLVEKIFLPSAISDKDSISKLLISNSNKESNLKNINILIKEIEKKYN